MTEENTENITHTHESENVPYLLTENINHAGEIVDGENMDIESEISTVSSDQVDISTITTIIKEEEMADMNGYIVDPTLHTEHAAIRHDVGLAEANIRDKVGTAACALEKAIGDNRYTISNEAAHIREQIGSESCAINKHIGDTRQEQAENFGHTRRDILSSAGDIRRELATEACDTNANILRQGQEGVMATKDARFDVSTRISNSADRIVDRISEHDLKTADRFFTVGRDLMDLRQGQATLSKDIELQALKTQLDAKENTRYLADKIEHDGEKTRALINDLKYHDLNRSLVERNAELVECEADRRHWRYNAQQNQYGSQWAQLQSQIQAFQSQLQETRQGLVNFGTMDRGAGQQTSTSNNVR